MDQSKFINTYIETVMNSLIENIKVNLQLQTQIKVSESVVVEKDQIIASLTQQINDSRTAEDLRTKYEASINDSVRAAEDWKAKYEAAETNYNAILGKLSHMDTLLNQVGEMKKIISDRNVEIEALKREIIETKNPKKVINTKTKKIVEEIQQEKTDDF